MQGSSVPVQQNTKRMTPTNKIQKYKFWPKGIDNTFIGTRSEVMMWELLYRWKQLKAHAQQNLNWEGSLGSSACNPSELRSSIPYQRYLTFIKHQKTAHYILFEWGRGKAPRLNNTVVDEYNLDEIKAFYLFIFSCHLHLAAQIY